MTATHYARLEGDGTHARITWETSSGHTIDVVAVIHGFDTPDLLGRAVATLAGHGFHADADWVDVTPDAAAGGVRQFLMPTGRAR